MPFMRGRMPERRTFNWLSKGKINLREQVRIVKNELCLPLNLMTLGRNAHHLTLRALKKVLENKFKTSREMNNEKTEKLKEKFNARQAGAR